MKVRYGSAVFSPYRGDDTPIVAATRLFCQMIAEYRKAFNIMTLDDGCLLILPKLADAEKVAKKHGCVVKSRNDIRFRPNATII